LYREQEGHFSQRLLQVVLFALAKGLGGEVVVPVPVCKFSTRRLLFDFHVEIAFDLLIVTFLFDLDFIVSFIVNRKAELACLLTC